MYGTEGLSHCDTLGMWCGLGRGWAAGLGQGGTVDSLRLLQLEKVSKSVEM